MLTVAAFVLLQSAAPPQVAPDFRAVSRGAQARFEAVRRMHLPRDRGVATHDRCDAQIGRYCYWHDSTEQRRPPDPPEITRARENLLALLDSLARLAPSDAWIAGQRVRYRLDARQPAAAVAAAMECGSVTLPPWWCDVLRGLAHHGAGDYAAAESSYDAALRRMDAATRCEWNDIRVLLPPRPAREMAAADCDTRSRMAGELWELGRPMWSLPGNDLRTEHYARLTMSLILATAANAQGDAWGADSRELVLRYGWPEWFSRHQDYGSPVFASPSVTGHDREPSFAFFPHTGATARVTHDSWALHASREPSRYAPAYVSAVVALPHQVTRFPRGDSMLVLVTFGIADTALAGDSVIATLGALGGGGVPRITRADTDRVARLTVPNDAAIVSLEAYGAHSHRLARERYTIDEQPRGTWLLSDILLYDPARVASDGIGIAAVAPAAIVTDRYSARAPLGLMWEASGMARVPAWMSVRIEPVREGWLRRLAGRLHLATAAPSVRVRWPTAPDSTAQKVVLRLPENARGRYRITLAVETDAGVAARASRELEAIP